MSKQKKVKKSRLALFGLFSLLIGVNVIVISYLLFLAYFNNSIFPGVSIMGDRVDRMSPQDAYTKTYSKFTERSKKPINLSYQNQSFTLDLTNTNPKSSLKDLVNSAYLYGRSGNYFKDFTDQMEALILGTNFYPLVTFDNHQILESEIASINDKIKQDSQDATINLDDNLTITPSTNGTSVDSDKLEKEITDYLSSSAFTPTLIPTKVSYPNFTTSDAQKAQTILAQVKQKPIVLHYQDQNWTIDEETLYKILNFHKVQPVVVQASINDSDIIVTKLSVGTNSLSDGNLLVDQDKLATYLSEISDKINQPVQEAKFNFQASSDGSSPKVYAFQPSKDGLELDTSKTALLINQDLESGSISDIDLPVSVIKPKITTENINNFGIKELIGQGISYFNGSIDNRIFNIKLAASRINGTLVTPGQIFSFDNTVGDISAETGYKQAYVIKSGRTVLDDGGGVCQVSTTLFRSVLNSGLPITDRTAHAYRVGYYEQGGFSPGLDATVFYPSVDFKFKNDTQSYVLIQAYTVGQSLHIDLYGTSDGRVATLTKPVVTDVTPPLPELRQDDPTLPKGVVKQVDFPAWGANVSFKRTVIRDGQVIAEDSWVSNFRPWQAVYLVGTK